jgi:hypothetical protein
MLPISCFWTTGLANMNPCRLQKKAARTARRDCAGCLAMPISRLRYFLCHPFRQVEGVNGQPPVTEHNLMLSDYVLSGPRQGEAGICRLRYDRQGAAEMCFLDCYTTDSLRSLGLVGQPGMAPVKLLTFLHDELLRVLCQGGCTCAGVHQDNLWGDINAVNAVPWPFLGLNANWNRFRILGDRDMSLLDTKATCLP